MPIPLLARIRKLIPSRNENRYREIVNGFGDGTFRPPATPMTDQELGAAIAEFLKGAPGRNTSDTLAKRFNRE